MCLSRSFKAYLQIWLILLWRILVSVALKKCDIMWVLLPLSVGYHIALQRTTHILINTTEAHVYIQSLSHSTSNICMQWPTFLHISRSSSDASILHIPRSNTSSGDNAFMVFAPKLWNALPLPIRQAPSLETFKKVLKTHLFVS